MKNYKRYWNIYNSRHDKIDTLFGLTVLSFIPLTAILVAISSNNFYPLIVVPIMPLLVFYHFQKHIRPHYDYAIHCADLRRKYPYLYNKYSEL